jgi:hypothetical protein
MFERRLLASFAARYVASFGAELKNEALGAWIVGASGGRGMWGHRRALGRAMFSSFLPQASSRNL